MVPSLARTRQAPPAGTPPISSSESPCGRSLGHRAARLTLDLSFALKLAIAVGATLIVYWIVATIIRGFGVARADDEPGDVQPVDLNYECTVCGTQITMTAAPDAEPVAPRHCMEEMRLVAPFTD